MDGAIGRESRCLSRAAAVNQGWQIGPVPLAPVFFFTGPSCVRLLAHRALGYAVIQALPAVFKSTPFGIITTYGTTEEHRHKGH
jgi:hypothetical protein